MRRGRMERVFGTLQKRLPQELRLANIKTMAAPIGSSKTSCFARFNPKGRTDYVVSQVA
jgi:hypothetical protein